MSNERVAYFADAMTPEEVRSWLTGMGVALRGIPGSDRLMEYEAQVNEVLLTHPVNAICQYDAGRFSGATVLNVLKVHPKMIVHGQVVHNPYYMQPRDFLKTMTAGAEL